MNQQSVAASDLDYIIRMGDPGENDLIGRKVADAPMGIFASEQYLARRSVPRSLQELRDHDIIGHTSEFVSFRNVPPGKRQTLEFFSAAAGVRSALRVNPVANHFTAAGLGLGLAFLAVPFARAEGLVQILPQETVTMNVWLLRGRESELRKLTREVRRFLEGEFAASRKWLAGIGPISRSTKSKA